MTYYDLNMNSKRINNTQDPASSQDVATKGYIDSIISGLMKQVKVERFTASGTWTVPTGVTYAVAHITAGGGAVGAGATNGSNSSVAFTSGTITATGGSAFNNTMALDAPLYARPGAVNSGQGGCVSAGRSDNAFNNKGGVGGNGAIITAGAAVVAGSSIAVVVGLGGTGGTVSSGSGDGGSGYVWIEYY